ncbi:hypothetical protein [Mangrovitalea sediminis]|uniref:hypothetical protein n=1 Tax=Mangrovitalea sediminis TaxID=1982043 RepID=UPI000BE4B808|nr:hypothetical protein [Mangrovitalea sediminis]
MFDRQQLAAWMLVLFTGSAIAAGLKDPTRPPDYQAHPQAHQKAASAFRLESILFGPSRRVAVINGTAVSPGERIDGARVMRIERTEVVLDIHGVRHVLKWHLPPQVRQ